MRLRLFLLVSSLTLGLAFVVPLLLGRLDMQATRGAGRSLLYFASIGLGFIMVEIALLQRYTLLLGQPLYAFAVVLGSMLVCSGIGSLLTHRMSEPAQVRRVRLILGTIAALALLHAFFVPAGCLWPLPACQPSPSIHRRMRVAWTRMGGAPLGSWWRLLWHVATRGHDDWR